MVIDRLELHSKQVEFRLASEDKDLQIPDELKSMNIDLWDVLQNHILLKNPQNRMSLPVQKSKLHSFRVKFGLLVLS